MKTLSILRHGKSSWELGDLKDIDRPLLEKGINRTKRVCHYMKEHGIKPDCIITSPAARAVETANIVIEELKLSLFPQISKRLYPGKTEAILDKLSELDRDVQHVMIVGHNPVFTDLTLEKTQDFTLDWLPTSGLITIDFNMKSWEYVLGARGTCRHYAIPKKLKEKRKSI